MKRQYPSTKETVQHKINTSFRMFINRFHADFPAHWHTDIEIICPKEAPYKIICANQTYHVEIDDIILICPAVIHEIFSPYPGTRVYIQADFSGVITLKEIDKAFRLMSPALHIKKKTCPPDIYNYLRNSIDKLMELYFGTVPSFSMHEKEVDESVISVTELEPSTKPATGVGTATDTRQGISPAAKMGAATTAARSECQGNGTGQTSGT